MQHLFADEHWHEGKERDGAVYSEKVQKAGKSALVASGERGCMEDVAQLERGLAQEME